MSDHTSRIAARIATTHYVILLKDASGRLTLLADPGESKPWSSSNKKLADFHAQQCDGEARTWLDAWQLLLKENPNFERELHERIQRNADSTFRGIDFNSVRTHGSDGKGTILGADGQPLPPSNS